jgi:ribosomal protein S18 acetylase RimI-like enzyme
VAGEPGDRPFLVRRGDTTDAPAAAALHARLISEGFLSSLGPRFLGLLYRRVVRSEGSFVLVAEVDSVTIGFIAGSIAVGRLYRDFVVRDGLRAGLSAPGRLLRAWPRVLETLRHPAGDGAPVGAELLAVAVDPAWRGRHVGGRLVEGFLDELEQRGVTRAHVVVGATNEGAVAMYGRAGFRAARTFEMHKGTPSLVMETAVPAVVHAETHPEAHPEAHPERRTGP